MPIKHQKIYMTMFLLKGNIFSKLYIKLFWSGTDDNDIARKVLAYIPDDFSGNLLDVPVGTAVFTENKWSSLKNAHITCIDYSMDMLEQARKRLGSHAHIKCIQRKRYWQRLRNHQG